MKNKFIKSTIILIIGGLITKVLGMIIKIVLTRTIGTEGISEYMLVLPTFNLFITLCNLGVPIAITKLISEKKNSSKRIVIPTTIIVLLYDFILIFSQDSVKSKSPGIFRSVPLSLTVSARQGALLPASSGFLPASFSPAVP